MKKHYAYIIITCMLLGPAVLSANSENKEPPVQHESMLVSADMDAGKARSLKEAGDIMSLEDLLAKVRKDNPGRVIEIELDEENGRYVYELELVDDQGKVWELELDAKNGELLKREQEDD